MKVLFTNADEEGQIQFDVVRNYSNSNFADEVSLKESEFQMEDVDLAEGVARRGSSSLGGRRTPLEERRGLVPPVDVRRQMQQGDVRESPDSFLARPYSWYDPNLIPVEYNRSNRT